MTDKRSVDSATENIKLLLNCTQTCEKYFNLIERRLKSQMEAAEDTPEVSATSLEMQLWQELKGNRNLTNRNIIDYLIGFYTRLQQNVMLHQDSSSMFDAYFARPPTCISVRDQSLFYNICIRLGDLNRYLKHYSLSKNFYLKAQELIPGRGQAYNQLALLCSSDPIKSIFYYCRAMKAVEEPCDISRSNIAFAVNKSRAGNALIRFLFPESCASTTGDAHPDHIVQLINTQNAGWLKVLLISIHSGNQLFVFQTLLDHLTDTLQSVHLANFVYQDISDAMAALDFLCDYVTSDEGRAKFDILKLESKLKSIYNLIKQKVNDIALDTNMSDIALKHDYYLHGLDFLHPMHSKLIFNEGHGFDTLPEMLINRLLIKFSRVFQCISDRKSEISRSNRKTRNIALQSIMGARKAV